MKTIILLSIFHLLFSDHRAFGQVCARSVSYTYYEGCGWWRTCARTGYRLQYYCCPGYTGSPCYNIDECAPQPCNNGQCRDQVNRFSCSCFQGFAGDRCDQNINECASGPCQNGATCTDGINSYSCRCAPGYSGKFCQININECASSPCRNGATCNDGVNSFTCSCQSPYAGTFCELNFNICQTQSYCTHGGECTAAGANTAKCTCFDGFTGSTCDQSIDECASKPCLNGAACLDATNAYVCFCAPGYNGINCQTNIYECASSPCVNGATCVDGIASYSCQCRVGYTGATCAEEINECNSNPCQNGGNCTNLIGRYTCTCLYGFVGPNCDQNINTANECLSNPCVNGGTCEDLIYGFKCNCPNGYEGVQCQIEKNLCVSGPCVNGGVCNTILGSVNCTCWNGYYGTTCEKEINECLSAPCRNGGVCANLINGYKCDCLHGFTGVNCVQMDDPATNNQILNAVGGVADTNIVILVFVIIIFLVIIAAIVFVVIRKHKRQPVIPQPIVRGASRIRNNLHNRYTSYFGQNGNTYHNNVGMQDNQSYDHGDPSGINIEQLDDRGKVAGIKVEQGKSLTVAYAEDEDMYIYGRMETDPRAKWKLSGDQLTLGKPLPGVKGQFAELRLATLKEKNDVTTIVAKMNKVGASEDDKLLMKAKMNYFGTNLSPHENIVTFIGAVPDGSLLLFEYCDEGRLLDWLKNLKTIDSETEDKMVSFGIQIARGMEHLHKIEVLHRRLGARNVLLKTNHLNQLVVKLYGFGPIIGEKQSDFAKEKMPLKWMAPEQLTVNPNEKRLYTRQTDVWSYAITLWEIYSKGETPYGRNIQPRDLAAKLKNGYRNERPKLCSDVIWDQMQQGWLQDPAERPNFEDIVNNLNRWYNRPDAETYNYSE